MIKVHIGVVMHSESIGSEEWALDSFLLWSVRSRLCGIGRDSKLDRKVESGSLAFAASTSHVTTMEFDELT